ncbi:Hsp20/alpha crystallin family protein [bacterium]|nr:Hsp20/alpha crystallin family protein [candidate division CSSED10-310 bacterium]
MTEKTVPMKTQKAIPATRGEERYLRPPVDIYETDDRLTVLCDMPGVKQDDVNVHIDKGVLTIEGRTGLNPEGEAILTEFALANYFRQFELNDQVDPDGIQAQIKHGVLKIDIPKAEQAKPKKIPVKLG